MGGRRAGPRRRQGPTRRGGGHAFSYALVDLLNVFGLYLLAPYWLTMMALRGKYREGLGQRFGMLGPRRTRSGCIWVHGVSVGEVLAARHLISRLGELYPGREVVISTTTKTGQAVARREYPRHFVFYYPFDLSFVLRRVLSTLRPSLLILLELEVWPNLLRLAESRQLPVVVLNGRLSPRSYRFYRRFGRFRLGFLNRVQHYGVQIEEFAARMRRLGIEPERVSVTGSLKYDTVPIATGVSDEQRASIRRRLGIVDGVAVLVFGSTHPSEAPLLAAAVERLRSEFRELEIVWVPRHPERVGAATEALLQRQLPSVRLSALDSSSAPREPGTIVIGDTIGDLEGFYAIATAVFVGKSLGREKGGQNMLEPAALGRAVVVGRNTQNFRTEVDYLSRRGALVVAEDVDELVATLALWLASDATRQAVGRAASSAVASLAGGTERSLEILRPLLEACSTRAESR